MQYYILCDNYNMYMHIIGVAIITEKKKNKKIRFF